MLDFATRHHAPDALLLVKEVPSTHQVGGWVGLRASLDSSGDEKISCSCQKLNARSSSFQPSHYTNYGIPVPTVMIIIQQCYKQACNNQNIGPFLRPILYEIFIMQYLKFSPQYRCSFKFPGIWWCLNWYSYEHFNSTCCLHLQVSQRRVKYSCTYAINEPQNSPTQNYNY